VIWIPKYRKPVLTGELAVRVRDIVRRVASEHEVEVISGKVARGHPPLALTNNVHGGTEAETHGRLPTRRNRYAR
jgi:putative transposase